MRVSSFKTIALLLLSHARLWIENEFWLRWLELWPRLAAGFGLGLVGAWLGLVSCACFSFCCCCSCCCCCCFCSPFRRCRRRCPCCLLVGGWWLACFWALLLVAACCLLFLFAACCLLLGRFAPAPSFFHDRTCSRGFVCALLVCQFGGWGWLQLMLCSEYSW